MIPVVVNWSHGGVAIEISFKLENILGSGHGRVSLCVRVQFRVVFERELEERKAGR